MKRFLVEGWCVWLLAAGLVCLMPGTPWHPAEPPGFSLASLAASALALLLLAFLPPAIACFFGPSLGTSRLLTLWESPPALLWGGLGLALWPRHLGPPTWGLWILLVLLATLPTEIRWLAQALPEESPFPEAWGKQAVRQSRLSSMVHLAPGWLAARWPLWLTATLVLERMLACPALGSDWMARWQVRHRPGLVLWILALGLLWSLRPRASS